MEIIKVKNYKVFAENLKKKTGCNVTIQIMNDRDHYHFQLDKDGISLGVLCLNQGEASFAPFVTLDTAEDDQYINVKYMPMLGDFISVLKVFDEMFVCEEES
jgi:short-subunit dehydrogenase